MPQYIEPAKERKIPQIPEQLEAFSQRLDELEKCIGALHSRLEPITGPNVSPSEEVERVQEKQTLLVPVAESLREKNMRLGKFIQSVYELLDRIEL